MANEIPEPTKTEIKERLRKIREGLKITKITATRSVKGPNGDSFVGFSAVYQSVQNDYGGAGADVLETPEDRQAYIEQGISLQEAKVARYMLAMECDIAALESAAANGSISAQRFQDSISGVKESYTRLILREMGVKNGRVSEE